MLSRYDRRCRVVVEHALAQFKVYKAICSVWGKNQGDICLKQFISAGICITQVLSFEAKTLHGKGSRIVGLNQFYTFYSVERKTMLVMLKWPLSFVHFRLRFRLSLYISNKRLLKDRNSWNDVHAAVN